MKLFGVLAASLVHFAKGLPLAVALAVAATATTVGLLSVSGPLGGGAAWVFVVLA